MGPYTAQTFVAFQMCNFTVHIFTEFGKLCWMVKHIKMQQLQT